MNFGGVENCCLGSIVEPDLTLLSSFWITRGAVLEPRGGLWNHLRIISCHLCATLGAQVGLRMIFNKFSWNFRSQNGSENRSGEPKKHEVVSGIDYNRFLRDFGREINVCNSTNCVFVEYEVKSMSTFQYS